MTLRVEPLVLSIAQAATQLQVHRNTVRRLIKQGSLRGVRVGGSWRIPRDEVFRCCGIEERVSVKTEPPGVTAPGDH